MLDIEYKGANAVVITTKTTQVVFDPVLPGKTTGAVSVDGAVEVVTEQNFVVKNALPKVCFQGPGEYEIGDVSLVGTAACQYGEVDVKNATIYRLTSGDLRVAVLGNIIPQLTEQQLEAIGMVDVVVLPVGGGGTLSASEAAVIVRQIDPKAVIPVHYADDEIAYGTAQEPLETFVGELGATVLEAGTKWKLKNSSALPEQLTLVKIARS